MNLWGDQKVNSTYGSNDRRQSDRFPIEREVKYRVLTNISSSGILFSSEHMLLPGRRLEVSISWPAQLNNKTSLRLVAKGRVVRFEHGKAAVMIQQYEFRTQSPVVSPGFETLNGPHLVS